MVRRSSPQASSSRRLGIRVAVVRGDADDAIRTFVMGRPEAELTVGSRGDWRITAPGVVGIHLRLAFDGEKVLAAAAHGSAWRGHAPLASEWCGLQEGDELRFGFALLRVQAEPVFEASTTTATQPSRKALVLAVAGMAVLCLSALALLVRRPAADGAVPNATARPATPSEEVASGVPAEASGRGDVVDLLPPPPALEPAPAPMATALLPQDVQGTDGSSPSDASTALAPAAFPQNIANRPIPRVGSEPWLISDEWRKHHERLLSAAGRATAKVIFLGDSITEGWWSAPAYKEYFGKYSPLNLGIASDTTQNVLWRIRHGALEGTRPGVVVTMVGINNLAGGFSAQDTAGGLRAIVAAIEERLPETKVLLLAILPARQDASNPLRERIAQCNRLLQSLARPGRVEVVDVGSVLLEPDGSISRANLRDYLHPTPAGYEKLSRAIAPKLAEMLGQ